MHDYKAWDDQRLKCEGFLRLGFGVIPYGQWASVFANPELARWPNLQCKAFCVWFPTMNDYLRIEGQLHGLCREAARRGLDCASLFDLALELASCYKSLLSLYTREEQAFIYDRRLQNVHGHLDSLNIHHQTVRWYNPATRRVEKERLSPDQYGAIMKQFYPTMSQSQMTLLRRLLCSAEGKALHDLYEKRLDTTTHLVELGRKLGVLGEVHFESQATTDSSH